MDDNYYSPGTLEKFIKTTLCDNDPVTYKHFVNENVKSFRKRLKKKDQVEQVVYVVCTDILRDIIYEIIEKMSVYMKDWGDLIITGGEAFNSYFDVKDRVVSSDIDTKFVPRFMSPFNKKFFGYLQQCKLILWNYMGQMCTLYNKRVRERLRLLSKGKIGKMLGIKLAKDPVTLKRRYTLMKKSREEDVLIDVELFALDLHIRHYCPCAGKLIDKKLGGILDVPMMRPYEVGYEVAFTRHRGVCVKHPLTEKLVYHKNILIASQKFLIEDLYLMKSLGLRPSKVKKDRMRMVRFAKNVLKIKGIDSRTPDREIFEKSIKSIKPTPVRKLVRKSPPKVNTLAPAAMYAKYTSEPLLKTAKKIVTPGIKTKNFDHLEGFKKTSGNLYFNRKTKTWKKSKNPHYVRNMYNFRSKTATAKVQNLKKTLYGYSHVRNKWVDPRVLKESAMIPLVGLKKNVIKKLVK